jgi:hypothetical protein
MILVTSHEREIVRLIGKMIDRRVIISLRPKRGKETGRIPSEIGRRGYTPFEKIQLIQGNTR